jgi:hypothetical protein
VARYAEGTTVTVESSRGEITGILAKNGVMNMGWQTGPEGDQLLFELKGRRYSFAIPKPTMPEIRKMYPNARDDNSKWHAEWRRRWRAIVLLLKAKLEFSDGETTTVERELMPYMLTADGRTTLGQLVEEGRLPQLMSGQK